jgi:hypothetical protein
VYAEGDEADSLFHAPIKARRDAAALNESDALS